jgi:uncharacterized phage infection (PIP) family protein YhgE
MEQIVLATGVTLIGGMYPILTSPQYFERRSFYEREG